MKKSNRVVLQVILSLVVIGAGMPWQSDAGQSVPSLIPPEVSKALYQRIKKAVDAIPLVDTHEHLASESRHLAEPSDVRMLFTSYVKDDLVSSGMDRAAFDRVLNSTAPLEELWPQLEPYWEKVRTTGYGRGILIAARDLYGISDINRDTYLELSKRMREKNKPGLYDWILKKKANIEFFIVDPIFDMGPVWTEGGEVRVISIGPWMGPYRWNDIVNQLGEEKRKTGTLDDYLAAFDTFLDGLKKGGMVAIKSRAAYGRIIQFDNVPRAKAEEVFNLIKAATHSDVRFPFATVKPMQDFIVHEAVARAAKRGLPVQIHTGILSGNRGDLRNTNPMLLLDLIIAHPEAKICIFHAGYPWTNEVAAIAKGYPNVYADFCWAHIISPVAARQALSEWIETIPNNKILGFGGDYTFPEGTYGHSVVARENVAWVISEKIASGYMTEEEGLTLARKILHDNAMELFKLGQARGNE